MVALTTLAQTVNLPPIFVQTLGNGNAQAAFTSGARTARAWLGMAPKTAPVAFLGTPVTSGGQIWPGWARTDNNNATANFGGGITLTATVTGNSNPASGFFGLDSVATPAVNFPGTFYTPTPPTTADLLILATFGMDSFTVTYTFSQPVTNPRLHFRNIDDATYDFAGTMTTSSGPVAIGLLSGNNVFNLTGTTINATTATANNGGCEDDKGGNPAGRCGTGQLTGTYTAIVVRQTSITTGDGMYFTITLPDTPTPTPCTIVCPSNPAPVAAAAGTCAATVMFPAPTVTGTCGTVTCSPPSGSSFNVGVTTVTCSATGAPMPTCTFTVTVNDTQAPTLTCPANIALNTATGVCTAVATYTTPTPTDNCSGATASCVPASGSTFNKGVTTVTCTATDASNNTAACTFTVTVTDNIPPAITCPANIFLGTTGTSATATWTAPTVSDNCPGVGTPTCTPASGSSFNVGVTTVTCTVADGASNTASCSFTVTVNRVGGTATDPLICTGPGNTVQATLVITNNGNVNQNVADTTTFTNLVGVPNPCVATPNVGTCVVTNGSLTYNGTLTPGQTVTLTYLTQVAGNAAPGAQVCTNNSVSFSGGTAINFSVCDVVDCPAAGPGGIFPIASEASDQGAGSVLIYNIYTSGATSGNTQNTRVNITNTNSALPAFVHLFFVAEGCSVADSYICLTANQTASFLASDLDPGTTGYIVAIAVNAIGCPTNFNYLIGDEYVKFTTGHAANLGAEAISALAGGLPFCDGNSVTSTLNFDGISYDLVSHVLALDNIGSRADGNDTLLILNRIGGNLGTGAGSLSSIFGIFYDDAENALSFTFNGGHQFRSSLSNNFPRLTPRFETFIPAGRTGWFKLWPTTGLWGMTGAAINFNANAASSSGAFNQGHNLHKLRLTNTANYTIPVFPPSC